MFDVIAKATWQTVYMVVGSTFFSVILGFIPAIVLTVTAPDGLRPNTVSYTHLVPVRSLSGEQGCWDGSWMT